MGACSYQSVYTTRSVYHILSCTSPPPVKLSPRHFILLRCTYYRDRLIHVRLYMDIYILSPHYTHLHTFKNLFFFVLPVPHTMQNIIESVILSPLASYQTCKSVVMTLVCACRIFCLIYVIPSHHLCNKCHRLPFCLPLCVHVYTLSSCQGLCKSPRTRDGGI